MSVNPAGVKEAVEPLKFDFGTIVRSPSFPTKILYQWAGDTVPLHLQPFFGQYIKMQSDPKIGSIMPALYFICLL